MLLSLSPAFLLVKPGGPLWLYPFTYTLALRPQCFSLKEEDTTALLLGLLAKIKVFGLLPAHLLWFWMWALFLNPFHCWSAQVLWIVTAQGGGGFWQYARERWRCVPEKSCCAAATIVKLCSLPCAVTIHKTCSYQQWNEFISSAPI